MSKRALRILGLDPGSRHTGWGVVERHGTTLEALAHGRISCSTREPLPQRLARLAAELEIVLNRWQPTAVALETVFQGLNPRSLIVLAQARGALLATASMHAAEIREYTPTQVKSAVTGHGKAGKEQVARMVRLSLSLGSTPLATDVSDALAVAICCGQRETFDRLTGHR